MAVEQEVKEYVGNVLTNQNYSSYSCFDCERLHKSGEQFGIGENTAINLVEQGYIDGYEQGQKDIIVALADYLGVSLAFKNPVEVVKNVMKKVK